MSHFLLFLNSTVHITDLDKLNLVEICNGGRWFGFRLEPISQFAQAISKIMLAWKWSKSTWKQSSGLISLNPWHTLYGTLTFHFRALPCPSTTCSLHISGKPKIREEIRWEGLRWQTRLSRGLGFVPNRPESRSERFPFLRRILKTTKIRSLYWLSTHSCVRRTPTEAEGSCSCILHLDLCTPKLQKIITMWVENVEDKIQEWSQIIFIKNII